MCSLQVRLCSPQCSASGPSGTPGQYVTICTSRPRVLLEGLKLSVERIPHLAALTLALSCAAFAATAPASLASVANLSLSFPLCSATSYPGIHPIDRSQASRPSSQSLGERGARDEEWPPVVAPFRDRRWHPNLSRFPTDRPRPLGRTTTCTDLRSLGQAPMLRAASQAIGERRLRRTEGTAGPACPGVPA